MVCNAGVGWGWDINGGNGFGADIDDCAGVEVSALRMLGIELKIQNLFDMEKEVYCKNSVLDIEKHGFSLTHTSDTGILFFSRSFGHGRAELMVSDNIYSLIWKEEEIEMMIANRYHIEAQVQLDFLIQKGRIGYLFTS